MTPEETELLAHTFCMACAEDGGTALAALDQAVIDSVGASGDLMTAWREDEKLRRCSRGLAAALVTRLEAAGFTIKPPKAKTVEEALDTIMTIPARKAYRIDQISKQA